MNLTSGSSTRAFTVRPSPSPTNCIRISELFVSRSSVSLIFAHILRIRVVASGYC